MRLLGTPVREKSCAKGVINDLLSALKAIKYEKINMERKKK